MKRVWPTKKINANWYAYPYPRAAGHNGISLKSGNGYRSLLVSFEVNSLIVVVADSMRVILIWLTWGAEMVQRLTCQCSFILLEQGSNYCYDQIHQRTVPYEVGETWREIARYRWKRLTNRLDTVISFIEVKWEFQKSPAISKKVLHNDTIAWPPLFLRRLTRFLLCLCVIGLLGLP